MYRIVALLLLFLASCNETFQAPEPEHLIEQKVMEDILFDIKLLRASKSKSYRILRDNNVQADTYIYEKYKLDSIVLRENIAYYATASFKTYKEMETNVKQRFEEAKKTLETDIAVRDSLKKTNDTLTPSRKKLLKPQVIDPAK